MGTSTSTGPDADMAASFSMRVLERLVVPGIPDVILAGPLLHGECHRGQSLVLVGGSTYREVVCVGVELLNWGVDRANWISVRVSDVDLVDVADVTGLASP